MSEQRPVVGFPGYEVTDDGRVISRKPYQGTDYRELAGTTNGAGYRIVYMTAPDGQRIKRYVHHLVAEAFIGERPPGSHVRHLDGDRTRNHATNLSYGSVSENCRDMVRHGTHNNARKTHCPQGHPYTAANTHLTPDGRRMCATCRRTSSRERKRALRAAGRAAA